MMGDAAGSQECFSLSYKTTSGLSIDLDLYLPPPQRATHVLRPVLVYFHGGGLTVGEKTSWLPFWLHARTIAAGYAFISANYRLLPPATGHDLVEDIKDLFHFIHKDINDSVEARGRMDGIDAHRILVAGTSAGGLCAYLAGIHAQPKPRAILSMYGMGADFFVSSFLTLDAKCTKRGHRRLWHLKTPHYLTPKVKPFFRGREILDPQSFSEYLYPNSTKVSPTSSSSLSYYGQDHALPGFPSNPRMFLARLYLQLGTLMDYYTGEHEPSLSEKLRGHLLADEQQNTTLFSLVPLRHRPIFPQLNLSAFPPAFLIHGSNDTAVPVHESHSLCESLKSCGISAVLRVCDGMEHSFDYEADAEQRWGAVFDEAFQFVKAHLSSEVESDI